MTDNERPGNAPPEGKEHLGPTQDASISGIPDQIDIEIAPDSAEEGAEPPVQAEQPKPKRPRSDPQRRIDQATARQREAETAAERLMRENKELLAKLEGGNKTTETERERADRAERAALVHHKRVQTLEQEAAQRDLQAAIEAGDAAKQGEATARLSSAAAELRDIANWEASHPEPKPGAKPVEAEAPKPEAQKPPEQRQQPELAAPAKAFLEENADWFQNDQEMRDELVSYASRYERRLTSQGRQAEINTEPYFDKLRQHMRAEFPDYEWDDGDGTVIPAIEATTTPPSRQQAQRQNGRMPQMSRDNSVLPANGQAAPGAKPQGERLRVELSDVEKELAVKQWENGVMGNHYKTGKPIATKEQAVEQWAYRKAIAAKNGRAA